MATLFTRLISIRLVPFILWSSYQNMGENVCPIYPIVSEKSFKNSKLFKECIGSLTFLPPFSFALFDGCYFSCSFVVVYLLAKGYKFSFFCPTRLCLEHIIGIEYVPCVCRRTSYTPHVDFVSVCKWIWL